MSEESVFIAKGTRDAIANFANVAAGRTILAA
jgi:hypothetical protein